MVWSFVRNNGWLLMVMAAVGLAACVVGMSELRAARTFRGAETVMGTISELQTRRWHEGTGIYSTRYEVTLLAPDGPVSGTVTGPFFETLTLGDALAVRIAGAEVEIEPGGRAGNGWATIVIGGLLVALSVWLGRRAMGRIRLAADLMARGTRAVATIEAVERTALRVRVDLRFVDEAGQDRALSLIAPTEEGVQPLEPGQSHDIYYDPAQPARALFAVTAEKLAPRRP